NLTSSVSQVEEKGERARMASFARAMMIYEAQRNG
nr:hypothetical protein [Tanacetum cinerariifolium]